MRKYMPMLFIIMMTYDCATAQYVNIPDNNFLTLLSDINAGACVNGLGQLDTTCPAILNDTFLNCSGLQIQSLEGIQYFKNLRHLNCSYNNLDSLLLLPNSLRHLECDNNTITFIDSFPDELILVNCYFNKLLSLPTLPVSLQWLNCRGNKLSWLPALPAPLLFLDCAQNLLDSLPDLPGHLDSLDCSRNYLIKLPQLPSTLQYLPCETNQLTAIPYIGSLKFLDCSANLLTSLPVYDSLQILLCGGNQIQRLPSLPSSLIELNCAYNKLDSIFNLPNGIKLIECSNNLLKFIGPSLPDSMQYFDCGANYLSGLPALPNSLTNFNCCYNLLTGLPELPDSLNEFGCYYNPYLQCLPKLKRINILEFDSTPITCLPNYGDVIKSTPPLDSVPLCGHNNPNGCQSYLNVQGIPEVDFSVYPNPANEYIGIQLSISSSYDLVLVNSMGQKIGKSITTQQTIFDTEHLASGLYFVNVIDNISGNLLAARKLVVMH